MTQPRDSSMQTQPDGVASPAPRARRISGFGARGEGIKVHGDEPFDPHRFQDFEVTPAFRQRILEAPLPLLELRDLLADQVPPSHQRARAGANDITEPAIPNSDGGDDDPTLEISDLSSDELELLSPEAQAVDRDATTAKLKPCPRAETPIDSLRIDASPIDASSTKSAARLPKRSLIIAGAVGLLFLGLAFAYLNKTAPVASPAQTTESDIEVPLLPEPKTAQNPAVGQNNLESPQAAPKNPEFQQVAPNRAQVSSQPAKDDSSSIKDPPRNATNSAKPNSKQGNAKKTLWLPAE